VIRIPILPAAGMPGTEHRSGKRWTFRLSAPPPPFSPASGLTLPGSPLAYFQPEPFARIGLSLAHNDRCLSTAAIPGSTFPA